MKAPGVFTMDAKDGTRKEIVKESVSGLEFGPDGRLYACQGSRKRIIAIHPADGTIEVIAEDAAPNDLAVSSDGMLYYTDTAAGHVVRINITTRERSVAAEGVAKPNGIALSNDGGTLGVSEYGGSVTWMFRVNADGSLDAGMPSMPLRQLSDPSGEFRFNEGPPRIAAARGDGMAVDADGRWYVTSAAGVQVFDPTGRPCGVLHAPDPFKPTTTCILAGSDFQTLFVAQGGQIFRRPLTIAAKQPKAAAAK
jgi:enterochelin esterase family protein